MTRRLPPGCRTADSRNPAIKHARINLRGAINRREEAPNRGLAPTSLDRFATIEGQDDLPDDVGHGGDCRSSLAALALNEDEVAAHVVDEVMADGVSPLPASTLS